MTMTVKKYQVILADPPWGFKNKNTGGSMSSGAASHYGVMSVEDICAVPVSSIADENCALFMWWVASQPGEALRVVDAWGFSLKTMTAFTWVKRTKNDKDFFGMGFWTRQGSENCLLAIKGKPTRASASVRAVTYAKHLGHSAKPTIVHDKILELMGDVPRVELFARNRISGWDAWGDEVDSDWEFVNNLATTQGERQ